MKVRALTAICASSSVWLACVDSDFPFVCSSSILQTPALVGKRKLRLMMKARCKCSAQFGISLTLKTKLLSRLMVANFVLLSCAVVPSSRREWDKRLMERIWAKTTRATFSKLLEATTSKVSPWSRVSWRTADHASYSRRVSSDTSPVQRWRSMLQFGLPNFSILNNT